MDEAVLKIGDREVTLPVITGTEGEVAIDTNKLRGQTGIVTHDKGFANTAEALSSVTFLDGEKGILRYRGYPIEQIADSASFLEVSYLCLYGRWYGCLRNTGTPLIGRSAMCHKNQAGDHYSR